jgi:hypothetical protein
MTDFICPVTGCEKELNKLQVLHFRSAHGCDPVEWVDEEFGEEIRKLYSTGLGSYAIEGEFEWLSRGMVLNLVESRSQQESVTGDNNPMTREEVVSQFFGENNPSKRPEVREKIRKATIGHPVSRETREKISEKNSGKTISEKNSGKTISEEHREAISKAASKMDRSYMRTVAYRNTLSEAQKGRKPTYPTLYQPDGLSHAVRSSWEEEIGVLLAGWGVSYEYEEEFELSIGSYYADFVAGRYAIEVKGFRNERSVMKAECFLEEFPSFTYVVVGDRIPCDIHISWENRERLEEVLGDGE